MAEQHNIPTAQCIPARQIADTKFCLPVITCSPQRYGYAPQPQIECVHVNHWPIHRSYPDNIVVLFDGLDVSITAPLKLHFLKTRNHPDATRVMPHHISGMERFTSHFLHRINTGSTVYTLLPDKIPGCVCYKPCGMIGTNVPLDLIEATLTFYPSVKRKAMLTDLTDNIKKTPITTSSAETEKLVHNLVKNSFNLASSKKAKYE